MSNADLLKRTAIVVGVITTAITTLATTPAAADPYYGYSYYPTYRAYYYGWPTTYYYTGTGVSYWPRFPGPRRLVILHRRHRHR